MAIFKSKITTTTETFAQNRKGLLALIEETRRLEARAQQASERSRERFEKRSQILPRERVARLLDSGAPFLEIGNMAGFLRRDQMTG